MSAFLFIVGLVLLIWGIGILIGTGWAFFLADIITTLTGSGPSSGGAYINADKKTFRGTRHKKYKLTGWVLLVLGLVSFGYSFL